jgi:hypothetical protein
MAKVIFSKNQTAAFYVQASSYQLARSIADAVRDELNKHNGDCWVAEEMREKNALKLEWKDFLLSKEKVEEILNSVRFGNLS